MVGPSNPGNPTAPLITRDLHPVIAAAAGLKGKALAEGSYSKKASPCRHRPCQGKAFARGAQEVRRAPASHPVTTGKAPPARTDQAPLRWHRRLACGNRISRALRTWGRIMRSGPNHEHPLFIRQHFVDRQAGGATSRDHARNHRKNDYGSQPKQDAKGRETQADRRARQ